MCPWQGDGKGKRRERGTQGGRQTDRQAGRLDEGHGREREREGGMERDRQADRQERVPHTD